MAKNPKKTKADKSKAKKPGNKKQSRKASAAELSDQERQALLLSHVAKVERAMVPFDEAKGELDAAFELAKKEGVTKKQIKFAIKLKDEENLERVKAERANEDFVARTLNIPIGSQLDMFGKQSPKDKAFAEGRIAGMSDQQAKPPKQLPTNLHNSWLSGHAEGVKAISVQRAENGFKPLGESVKDLAEKAGIAAGFNEPAPSQELAH